MVDGLELMSWYDFAYGTWLDGWLNIDMRFGMHDKSMFGWW